MHEHSYKLGEYINWKDTGCDLSPACLECHLPHCADEKLHGRRKIRMKQRARAMIKMRRASYKTRQISMAFGVSMRTVQRALKRKNGRIATSPRDDVLKGGSR